MSAHFPDATRDDKTNLRFPVFGIGASAGGLEAVLLLLAALPPHTGMAFVVVQHLQPDHPSHLPEIFARATTMPVVHAQNGVRLQPDHVYVVPPNVVLTIREGTLRLAPRDQSIHPHFPIDAFFSSLAEDQGMRAIGIVLSGNSSDGAQGLRTIKCALGTTFAQTESSAKYGSMPHSAIATGAVDFILSPQEIAAELARIGTHPFSAASWQGSEDDPVFEHGLEDVQKMLVVLRNAKKVDFSQYKQNTVRRRIARRQRRQAEEDLRRSNPDLQQFAFAAYQPGSAFG